MPSSINARGIPDDSDSRPSRNITFEPEIIEVAVRKPNKIISHRGTGNTLTTPQDRGISRVTGLESVKATTPRGANDSSLEDARPTPEERGTTRNLEGLVDALGVVFSRLNSEYIDLRQANNALFDDFDFRFRERNITDILPGGKGLAPASVYTHLDREPAFGWVYQGQRALESLLAAAGLSLDTARNTIHEKRNQALNDAADILALAAVATDILRLHTGYLGIWKTIVDSGARGTQILGRFYKEAQVFFVTIQPFIQALVDNKRDLAFQIFTGIEANINKTARPTLIALIRSIEKGYTWSRIGQFLGDLILFAFDAWEIAKGLTTGFGGSGGQLPPKGPLLLAGAQVAYAIPVTFEYAEALAIVFGVATAHIAAGKFSGSKPKALRPASSAPRGTAQEYFSKIYKDLKANGWKPKGSNRAIRPDPKLYPSVETRPNGDVFGNHKDLTKYLRDNEVTGKRGVIPTIESHHLLERDFMRQFGITPEEGRAVAIEVTEHGHFSGEIPKKLGASRSSQRFYDIDDLYKAHVSAYREAGYSEWVPQIDDFLRQNRNRIKTVYNTGQVPGANLPDWPARLARVRRFLDNL